MKKRKALMMQRTLNDTTINDLVTILCETRLTQEEVIKIIHHIFEAHLSKEPDQISTWNDIQDGFFEFIKSNKA